MLKKEAEELAALNSGVDTATSLICVKRLPVIEEHLKTISAEIDKKIEEVSGLVATEDTIQTVKNIRTQLNKEFAEFEDRRKIVKTAIMAPYDQFESVYRENVSNKYKSADSDLKAKITNFEDILKAKKTDELKGYFTEYAASKKIDFVAFEKVGCNVTLSATMKSLKEQVKTFLDRVSSDLELIDVQENTAEILVEYKQNLDVSRAITTVAARHKAIEEEKAATETKIEETKTEQEAVKKIDAVSRPVVVEAAEPEFSMTFRVTGTKPRLVQVKKFLDDGGYKYE